MIAIAFRFRASRFHATQWGRHVNEGVAEWPPSPWRILRALVSVWLLTMPEVPPTTVVPILERLATELPGFHLPDATAAHTRHYMPLEKADDRTLVIDSFVVTGPGDAVVAIWPSLDLAPEQRDVLARILANQGYLGRAESWCDGYLVAAPPVVNCLPLAEGTMPPGDWDIVRVLVPRTPLRLKELCVETADLRGKGKVDPPGAQWRQYIRPTDCLSSKHEPVSAPARAQQPTVVRYVLAGKVLPLVIDTVRVAELARQSAMSQYGRANGGAASPILSGKAPNGVPLEGHQHAFYLPTDEDEDGRIDHLTVWVPAGLDEKELHALASVQTLNRGGGRPEVRLAFLACAQKEEFGDTVPILRTALVWRTATPFVLNRHIKRRGPSGEKRLVDGPAEQVRTELNRRPDFATPVEAVDHVGPPEIRGWRTVYPLEFYRWRRSDPPSGGAFNFRLSFREPVAGPISLGYACHFGLGLFVPTDPEEDAENVRQADTTGS